jgi:hypothetical protein
MVKFKLFLDTPWGIIGGSQILGLKNDRGSTYQFGPHD